MIAPGFFKALPLGLLYLQGAYAAVDEQIATEGSPVDGSSSALALKVSTSFPDSEIFGVKLVNGNPTNAVLSFTNNEPAPVSVRFIGGSLWTSLPEQQSRLLRNLTAKPFMTSIPAGSSESISYKFTTDMHPQDVRLNLIAMVMGEDATLTPIVAFNETVAVVEAPSSILDPQNIFLYLVLTGFFGAIVYGIYSYWITALFPQQKKRVPGKGGERAKASSQGSKKVDPSKQVNVLGADGPAVAMGSKGYDESWIPAQHLKKPEPKRVRSGTPSGVKTKKA